MIDRFRKKAFYLKNLDVNVLISFLHNLEWCVWQPRHCIFCMHYLLSLTPIKPHTWSIERHPPVTKTGCSNFFSSHHFLKILGVFVLLHRFWHGLSEFGTKSLHFFIYRLETRMSVMTRCLLEDSRLFMLATFHYLRFLFYFLACVAYMCCPSPIDYSSFLNPLKFNQCTNRSSLTLLTLWKQHFFRVSRNLRQRKLYKR